MATNRDINNLIINKVESKQVYDYMVQNDLINDDELYLVQGAEDDIVIDSSLSSTSENPVQNKVVKAKFDSVDSSISSLQTSVDGKANSTHTHSISNITNLQSSLDGKQATISGAATTITSSNLTANRALISNASGKVAVSAVTSTELGYLDGVTSSIQTQLDGKAEDGHNHDGRYYTESEVDTQLNTKAPKANPTFTGSISMSRKSGSTTGFNSVTVGDANTASGSYSFASGSQTEATAYAAFSTGSGTEASGDYTFVTGVNNTSQGDSSVAMGEGNTAVADCSFVHGKYSVDDTNGNFAHIVGIGTGNSRANGYTLDWEGNANFAGNVYVGNANSNKAGKKLTTEEYVDEAVANAVGDAISQLNTNLDKSVADYLAENPVSGGMTTTAKNLLIAILRNVVYTNNQSANITALEIALGTSSSEPEVVYYQITNVLTNVSNENNTISVLENSSYIANIIPIAGYTLDNVIVTMGGVDITSTVYADGVITIPAVTGSVEIVASATEAQVEAVLPTDGLVDFFDFRNAEPTINTTRGLTSYAGTNGGSLYAWSASIGNTSDDYGSTVKRGLMYDRDGGTTQTSLGNNVTTLVHAYVTTRGFASMLSHNVLSNVSGCLGSTKPSYVNTSGSTTTMSNGTNDIPEIGLDYPQYINMAVSTDDTNVYFYINGELAVTRTTSEVTDFASWNNNIGLGVTHSDRLVVAACAVYERTLSDVEIVEACEYFKTLEVA